MARLREPVRAHEARHAGADDRDPHGARGARRRPARPRALLAIEVPRARDHVERPLLDLVVDAPEVLADHAEREQLDAADQQHGEQQRRHAALVDAGVAGDDRQRQRRAARTRAQAKPASARAAAGSSRTRSARRARSASSARAGTSSRPPSRASRSYSTTARGSRPRSSSRAGSGSARAARSSASSGARSKSRKSPALGSSSTCASRPMIRVEPARGRELQARLAAARRGAWRRRCRRPRASADQLGDQLGRVLEVAVDHHHRVAAGVVEARGDRHLVAERAREVQRRARAGPRRPDPSRIAGGAVGRPVVDDHELVREALRARRRRGVQNSAAEPLLVEHRRHHAEQAQLAGGHGRRKCQSHRYDPGP